MRFPLTVVKRAAETPLIMLNGALNKFEGCGSAENGTLSEPARRCGIARERKISIHLRYVVFLQKDEIYIT